MNVSSYLNFTVGYAVFVLVYSVYSLYLNKRQADVLKHLRITNDLLSNILAEVKK